jgi:FMN-dependent NADH-azoreductase
VPHLLHLDSAAALKNSRSREITATFADTWRGRGPQYTVTYRDLHRDPLPHLVDAVLHWPPRKARPRPTRRRSRRTRRCRTSW